jgi:hypothetical protein
MADELPGSSEASSDPVDSSDSPDEESPPADDSYLVGATGVEEQVLAELARAEASINDPKEHDDDSDGAVV